jgi:hypothetical protein
LTAIVKSSGRLAFAASAAKRVVDRLDDASSVGVMSRGKIVAPMSETLRRRRRVRRRDRARLRRHFAEPKTT